MNWINQFVRPKLRNILEKKEVPDNLWVKCPQSGEMVFYRDLEANQWVVPNSGHHMRIKSKDRFKFLFDGGAYETLDAPEVINDPLKFKGIKKYADQLKDSRNKTGQPDAILAGVGQVHGTKIVAAVQDFAFMGGSLGMAAGESIIKAIEKALELNTGFVMFAASGGARMQEGILSLMQMPRTTVAVQRLREASLPYIVVFTNPTTGGVSASYAMLGDIHLAEPGALIGFAGPRVIEQTIREKLPTGFQRSEYLYDHGMVDMVVHRHDLPQKIATLIAILSHRDVTSIPAEAPIDTVKTHDAVEQPAAQADKQMPMQNPSNDDAPVQDVAE